MSLPVDPISFHDVRIIFTMDEPVKISEFYKLGIDNVPMSGTISLADLQGKSIPRVVFQKDTTSGLQTWKGVYDTASNLNVVKLNNGTELEFIIVSNKLVYQQSSDQLHPRYAFKCFTDEFKDLYLKQHTDSTLVLAPFSNNEPSLAFRVFQYDSNFRIYNDNVSASNSWETWPYMKKWVAYRSNDDRVVSNDWMLDPANTSWGFKSQVPAEQFVSQVLPANTMLQRFPPSMLTAYSTTVNTVYGMGTYSNTSYNLNTGLPATSSTREAYRAFDYNKGTVWQPGSALSNAELKINMPNQLKLKSYILQANDGALGIRMPLEWRVDASSNQGATWEELSRVARGSWANGEIRDYAIPADLSEKFFDTFRYVALRHNPGQGSVAVGELGMLGYQKIT